MNYYTPNGFLDNGIVIHLAPPPPRGNSDPSIVSTQGEFP